MRLNFNQNYHCQNIISHSKVYVNVKVNIDDNKDNKSMLISEIIKLTRSCNQIKSGSDKLSAYKRELRNMLTILGYKTDASDFEFSPIDLIGEAFLDLDDLIADATSSVDQGDWKREWKKVGSHQEKLENHWYKPWEWFTERYETVDDYDWVKTWESNWVEYVNMHEVVGEYYSSLYASLSKARKDIPSHIAQETKRLKHKLNEQIKKVDQLLAHKLKELQESIENKDKTQVEIEQQESNLEWMNGIIDRVNNLINF
mgnify:CR=1 FL=1